MKIGGGAVAPFSHRATGGTTPTKEEPAGGVGVADLCDVTRFFFHPPVEPSTGRELAQEAADPTRSHLRWRSGAPLSEARNAHNTNTPEEMLEALQGDYNFFEGDVHLEAAMRGLPLVDRWREPIMAHDPNDVHGLTFREWLDLAETCGRGIKIDIKQAAAIPKIVEEVKRRNLPEERLIFNADVIRGPGARARWKLFLGRLVMDKTAEKEDLRFLRREFPRATIAVGAYTGGQPAGTSYTAKQLDQLAEWADELGGPITFPLRAEFITPEVVARLKPHGTVSAWNDPSTYRPDPVQETARLRALGVDGMIDLRS